MPIPSDVSPRLEAQTEASVVQDRQYARFGRGEPYFLMGESGSRMTVEKEWQLVVDGLISHVCVTRSFEAGIVQCTENSQEFDCRTAKCHTCVDLDYDLYPEPHRISRPVGNGEPMLSSTSRRRRISTYLYSIQKSSMSGCPTCLLLFDGIKQVSGLPHSSFQALEGSFPLDKVEISLKIGEPIYVVVFGMEIEFYSHGRCTRAIPWSFANCFRSHIPRFSRKALTSNFRVLQSIH